MESVALRIPIQAAGVDDFIKQLRERGKGNWTKCLSEASSAVGEVRD